MCVSSDSFYRSSRRLLVAVCLCLLSAAALSAQTKVEPCATMGGKPKAFNAANGNPYYCTVSITTNADGSEDVIINQPVVGTEARNGFRYPMIPLHAEDLITIAADGCVQVAGSGKTWKRYVNPSGKVSGPHVPNGLYFGTISIAGAVSHHGPVAEGTPLDDLGVNLPHTRGAQIFVEPVQQVPGRPPEVLVLGYVDDNYDDYGGNGYWGHDDGDNGQCANTDPHRAAYGTFGGPAFVRLHIVHNAENPFSAHAAPARQWDLVPHGFDANGLPLNPEWGWQVNGGSMAKDGNFDPSCLAKGCSSQDPKLDNASLTSTNWPSHLFANVCNFDTGPSGHHNWFDVTYTGKVKWVKSSGEVFGDDDYNMRIVPPIFHADPAGTSFGNNNTPDSAEDESFIGLEFDSEETIDRFDQNAFWQKFHHNVDTEPNEVAAAMVDGQDVVVIGLMGFDEMHGAHTEIHPVHALAIREGTQGQELEAVNPSRDRWVFFVRNWGDEGECSRYQHYLQADAITLQIPPPSMNMPNPPKFTTATLTRERTDVHGMGTNSVPSFYSGQEGTFVTFVLSDAVSQPFAYGEFELAWTEAAGGSPAPHRTAPAHREQRRIATRDIPEERLARIWNAATPQQQQLYRTLLAELSPPKRAIAGKALTVEVVTSPPKRPEKAPAVTIGPATEKLQRDTAHWQAMCAATGGKLPTQTTWCSEAKVPPVTILTTTGGGPLRGAQRTPVTATLTVYDASGLGIGPTQYSLDGKTWTTYTGPFPVPGGNITLYHRSQDRQGNLEEIREHKFNVTAEAAARETH